LPTSLEPRLAVPSSEVLIGGSKCPRAKFLGRTGVQVSRESLSADLDRVGLERIIRKAVRVARSVEQAVPVRVVLRERASLLVRPAFPKQSYAPQGVPEAGIVELSGRVIEPGIHAPHRPVRSAHRQLVDECWRARNHTTGV